MVDRNDDSNLATTAPDDAMRHIFRFFDLPRELRDEIYDLSLTDYEPSETLKCGFHLRATEVPATNLLLVSRNFSNEYALRAKKKSRMAITDSEDWRLYTKFPPAADRVSNITANLTCTNRKDAVPHRDWIIALVERGTSLSSLSIRVNYDEASFVASEGHGLCFEDWPLVGISAMKVYKCSRPVDMCWDFETQEGLWLELSKTTGKVEEVETTGRVEAVGEDQPGHQPSTTPV